MKSKLTEYINIIFADAERRSPRDQRLAELKEEMQRNLEEKYDDLIASGRTPAAAYNIAVAGVGDISGLLESVTGAAPSRDASRDTTAPKQPKPASRALTAEERDVLERYRRRSAILTPAAIALYILSVIPCVIVDHVISVVLLFLAVAVATVLLIYNYMSRPKFDDCTDVRHAQDRDEDDEDDEDEAGAIVTTRPRRSPVYRVISGALWSLMSCFYVVVSLLTGAWHLTWMIFPITAALDNIIKALFDLRR